MTYISLAKGFVCLVTIIGCYSRKMLSWQLSNTLDAASVSRRCARPWPPAAGPESFNTDQGSQFTSAAFTSVLREHDIQISLDGRGRWVDNVFVERLWRGLKYEEVYLKAYGSDALARVSIGQYMAFFNTERRHQALRRRTPDAVYSGSAAQRTAA